MTIEILEVEYHRNGIGGEPFYAVAFKDHDPDRTFVATVFGGGDDGDVFADRDEAGRFVSPRVAVLEVAKLPSVTFGENSWRGDHYANALFAAIEKHKADEQAEFDAKWLTKSDGSAV